MAEKSKKIVQIEIETNAGKATKEFEQLSNGVLKAADSAEKLDASFDDVYNGMAPLTTRMGEAEDRLYELALAGDTASQEYQELLTKVGEYRKVQIQTDLAVDGAATTMTQKLGGALNGVTSGFAATQGAMALFGDENEALEKSLLKVQSALAIQQGVQGLTEAYRELGIGTKIAGAAQAAFTFVTGGASTALKVFRAALVSTGIGALVVAVGLLVANFDKLLVPIQAAVQALKDFADAVGLTSFAESDAAELQKDAETQRLQMIKDIRASQEEAHKRRMAEMEEERRASEQGWNDWLDILRLQGQEERANFIERTTLSEAFWFDRTKDVSEYTNEELKAYKALLEFDKKVADERKRNYQEYAAARLSAARQIEDIENSLLTDGIEKELEINRDKFRRLREDVKGNREERKILTDLYNQQEAQAEAKIIADNQKRREDAFETERSDRVELLNFVDELNTKEVESEKAKNLAILDNAVETNEKLIESDKAVAEAKKNIQDAQIANVEAGISLLKDVAGENNKLQALAIAAENAVGIAKIIISTQAANAAAKLKYAAIPGGLALAAAEITANKVSAGIGIAASVAAAAKGIASLKQSASLDSGGNLGGGGSGTEAAVPQFNVVGDSGINQIAQLQQQPVQAFVVSGEVTTSQALDRNRVQNATL